MFIKFFNAHLYTVSSEDKIAAVIVIQLAFEAMLNVSVASRNQVSAIKLIWSRQYEWIHKKKKSICKHLFFI